MTLLKTAGLVAIAASAVSPAAFAQDFFQRDRYEAVTDRYQPDFDQEPIRVGTFLASPVLTAGLEATDNVFATPDNEQEDIAVLLGVATDIESDWGRHEIGGNVSLQQREYLDFDDESVTTLSAAGRGRLDVTSDFFFDGTVFATRSADPRTSEAVFNRFAEPVEFTQLGTNLTANYIRDRIRLQGFVNVTNFDYDDATLRPEAVEPGAPNSKESQGFRSSTLSRFGGQAAYAISPDVAIYAQAEINQRDYDELTPLGDVLADRDSEGYRLEIGTDFELPSLLRGDVAVGYLEENRDEPFVDFDGLSIDGTLSWFPSRLTTVTAAAGRRTVDVGIIEAGGALETDLGVRVDHELRRNVLLFARAEYINREFDDIIINAGGSTRDDDTWFAGLGGTYKINKRFHVDASYNLFDRSSNVRDITGLPFADFTRNTFALTLRVFP